MTDVKASMDTQDTQSLGGFMCLSDYEETNHLLEIHKTQWEVRGSMLALHDLDKISFTSINSRLEKYVVIRVDILELVMVNIPCKGGGVQQCFPENNRNLIPTRNLTALRENGLSRRPGRKQGDLNTLL